MIFNSIPTFRSSLDQLCKKERNGYHLCKNDIYKALENMSFKDIWELNYLIKDSGNIRVIKLRVPNSFQNLSSADGFRLIICCNRTYEMITFLNLYPKRGKLGMADQTKEDFKRQLNLYGSCLKDSLLVTHDLETWEA